jgi:hypothetical protein
MRAEIQAYQLLSDKPIPTPKCLRLIYPGKKHPLITFHGEKCKAERGTMLRKGYQPRREKI